MQQLPHGLPSPIKRRREGGKRKHVGTFSFATAVLVCITAVLSFFVGSISTLYAGVECTVQSNRVRQENANIPLSDATNALLESRVQQEITTIKSDLKRQFEQKSLQFEAQIHAKLKAEYESKLKAEMLKCKESAQSSAQQQSFAAAGAAAASAGGTQPLFPQASVGRYAVGMARASKDDFTRHHDLGVPAVIGEEKGDSEILVLYSKLSAVPDAFPKDPRNSKIPDSSKVPLLKADDALEHCDFVNVILTDSSASRNQCVAVVPQYESYHVQKWMRIDDKGKLDPTQDLQLVSRGHKPNGRQEFAPPHEKNARQNWQYLSRYFENVDTILGELDAILKQIAVNNTVIVMVCNFGQAELLMNFVCSAKSRGLDISNVIVFTTDQETTDLATSLGLKAYFDHRNFGDIPKEAAGRYGDAKFVAMMMAKVICVQLVSMLGYDFLFQDVDIVWFKNPLEYFALPAAKQFDVFFQDDGSRSVRYAPYSANSGFYFIRHNDRTRHFLTSLLLAGDLILKTDSHQQALIAVLSEHVSLFGLKAKVLSRDEEEFPGGWHWNQHSGKYLRSFFQGDVHPYIFHMSWTKNKDNKLLYFRQMGEWFTKDMCIGKTQDNIVKEVAGASVGDLSSCCAAQPLFSCHYRDKPSKTPCKDSPPIDKGRPSWW